MGDLDAAGLSVFVPGHPAPQGSKKYVGNGVMIEMVKRVKPWRESVRAALINSHGQPIARFDGAVHIYLEFIMPRPVSTPKKHTPLAVKKPDWDKLSRAIGDAVTSSGVWRDDSQVVRAVVDKRLAEIGETPGCRIELRNA